MAAPHAAPRRHHPSIAQASRVFRDACKMTPLAYLTKFRIIEMARLLRETDLTIAVITRRLGWNSPESSVTAFACHYGVTVRLSSQRSIIRFRSRAGRRRRPRREKC
ncbi:MULTISPECIES: helix-turn-helix domain-containing protein [Micrococcales]|nr:MULTISPECIES: helix-turn-helix domain-containing protein [Micrococcales]